MPFLPPNQQRQSTEGKNTDKQTQYKSEKVNNLKYSKTNYPGSVASYNTPPGNEVGLFYNAPEPTRGIGGHPVSVCGVLSDGSSWLLLTYPTLCCNQIRVSQKGVWNFILTLDI